MIEGEQRRKETLLHFGGFTLNLDRRGLYRGEERVRLTSKPLETLIFLVENRNQVVEKQTLLNTVWRGTFVTEDVLVQSVREIRRVLGDNKENPRFIQTVPRQGYRFVGEVSTDSVLRSTQPIAALQTTKATDVDSDLNPAQAAVTNPSRRSTWFVLLLLAALVPLVWFSSKIELPARLMSLFRNSSKAAQPPKSRTRTLLTTGKFSAGKPALSADGKLLLFVSSTEDTQEKTADGKVRTYGDLFVRQVSTGSEVRITERENPSGDIPVFTADGSHVAFSNYRHTESGTSFPDLYLVLSGGGVTGRSGEPYIKEASGAGFSPDGQSVAYTKHLPAQKALWLSPADQPEKSHREIAPNGFTPRWSWDGRLIAYTTSNPNGGLGDLWVVDAKSLSGARNLTNEPQQMYGLTWTPDGQHLIFASKRSGPSLLWRVPVAGGPVQPVTELTGDFAAPSMSRLSRMLVFSHFHGAQNLMLGEGLRSEVRELSSDEYHKWSRLSPSGVYVASVMEQPDLGKHLYVTDLKGNHTRLSEFAAHHPCWAGDDRLAYLQWDGETQQTHVLEANISNLEKPITTPLHTFPGQAEWLAVNPADATRLAVIITRPDGAQQIVLRDVSQGTDQVVASGSEYANLRWSPDGSTLAWSGPEETSRGSNGIWLKEVGSQVEPRRLVQDGYGPVWGPDGATIYFSRIGAKSGLWQVDLRTNHEELIRGWQEVSYFDIVKQRLVFCQLGSSGKNRVYAMSIED